MTRIVLAGVLFLMGTAFVWAQRDRIASIVPEPVRLEVRSVFPREVSPGKYEQVDQRTLQQLSDQGWELVSVTPYIYRNEERGPEMQAQGPRPVVTQTYPAYFFKRIRVTNGRNASVE
jgi:hypothetical protein